MIQDTPCPKCGSPIWTVEGKLLKCFACYYEREKEISVIDEAELVSVALTKEGLRPAIIVKKSHKKKFA